MGDGESGETGEGERVSNVCELKHFKAAAVKKSRLVHIYNTTNTPTIHALRLKSITRINLLHVLTYYLSHDGPFLSSRLGPFH